MNGLATVFRFEYTQQVRKKAFVATTVLLACAAVFAALCPIIFASALDGQSSDQTLTGGVYYADPSLAGTLPFDQDHTYESEDDLRNAVEDGTESMGFVIKDLTHITTYYKNYTSSSASDSGIVQSMLQQAYVTSVLASRGVSPDEYQALLATPVDEDRQILGRDSTTQYMTAIVYIVVVYIVVLFFGQTVATAVAREKDSKTMELLITSTRPTNLILGKVIGLTCAALTQIGAVVCAGGIAYLAAHDSYPQGVRDFLSDAFDGSMLGVYLLNFVLALALFMVLYAALGSLVSRVEDVSTAVTPVMLLVVIAYLLAFLAADGATNAFVTIGSWIPFFSVFVMPIRFSVGTASWVQIVGSTVLTLACTVALAYVSVRIYRWGTLRYGTRIKLFTAIRKAFSSQE
ncbi:MAG: ABC transporter permease [Bifidobacteriaceae bacterium]|nr:ABC transporter permease [Bifidobacteriaceae bacterium]